MNICPSCNQSTVSKTCPTCGIPTAHRIDGHFVAHEIRHSILHLESGLLYTIKEMLLRPGITVRNYINGDRSRHYKPLGFLVITSVTYLILKHYLHFREAASAQIPSKNTAILMEWVSENYTYSNLILIVFIALLLRLFFYALRYNFFEYLVLLCFLTGIGMLMSIVAMLISIITGSAEFFGTWFLLIAIIYTSWGIGQFAGGGALRYLKAFFAYILGMMVFLVIILVTGITMDLLKL